MLQDISDISSPVLGQHRPSRLWLNISGFLSALVLACLLVLLLAPPAKALTYVNIVTGEPDAPKSQDLAAGVDITVYWSVYTNGHWEWWHTTFDNQHDFREANKLIDAQLRDNQRLPVDQQHEITIGWHRHR